MMKWDEDWIASHEEPDWEPEKMQKIMILANFLRDFDDWYLVSRMG